VVGAGRAAVLLSLFREVLGPGFLAISGGLIAGEIVASLVGTYGVLIVFSHAIQPQFDLLLALEILAIAVATTALSCILCGNASLKRDPRDLIAQVEPKREELPEEAMQL
jgi:ABC-type antimicrobial peptide transport system permease subunit